MSRETTVLRRRAPGRKCCGCGAPIPPSRTPRENFIPLGSRVACYDCARARLPVPASR
jgi:hypothetical protein